MKQREAVIFLTDYVKGSLSDEQRVAVEKHVETNPECRETVLFLKDLDRDLAQHSELFASGHPDADDIVEYAIDGTDSGNVANHVSDCLICFEEVQKVRLVYTELVNLKPKKKKVVWFLAAALLSVAMLVIFVPQGEHWSGSAPVIHVRGVMRSVEMPEVVVTKSVEQLPMVMQWDPWTDREDETDFNLLVSIIDDTKTVLEMQTTATALWDDNNKVSSVVIAAGVVGHGVRTVKISDDSGAVLFNGQFLLTLQ